MKTLATLITENIFYAEDGKSETFTGTDDTLDIVSYENDVGTFGVHVSLTPGFTEIQPYGESDNDTFSSIEGLIGTKGHDRLAGTTGVNVLRGGQGDDTLYGLGVTPYADFAAQPASGDTLDGGEGIDTVSYHGVSEGVIVNLGSSHIVIPNGSLAANDVFINVENLTGSAFNDVLIGDAGNNRLEGGLGSDTLIGGEGADKFYGSFETAQNDSGIDVVSYAYAKSAIAFDITYSITEVGEAIGDRFSGIEHFIGSNFSDTMGGTMYAETFEGGAGDDMLWGYEGADKLIGGAGFDWACYFLGAAVEVNLTTGIGKGGEAEGDVLVNIEALRGTRNGDKFIGDKEANILDGRGGADTMSGGAGDDTYYVDQAGDQVNEGVGEGTDLVITEVDYALGANVENLTAKAGSFANFLTGNELNNVITGNEKNNHIDGGLGADTMIGGAGDDTYVVNDINDVVIDTSGYDVIYTSINYVASGSIEKVIATGNTALTMAGDAGNNEIAGNDAANLITGGLGNDSLWGNAGDDKIYGGSGNDILSGGAGKDIFVFDTKIGTSKTNKSVNYDRIVDFNVKDDTIYLDNAVFKKLGKGSAAKPGKLKKDFFKVANKAKDKNDYLVYDKKKGVLYYDADGSGSKKAIEIMKFDNKAKLTASDFFVI